MKITTYLVYRHGSNSRNQSMRDRMPVALVEATSRAEACKTVGPSAPRIDLPACWLASNPEIECWANQHFSAVPCSKAPAGHIREVEERS